MRGASCRGVGTIIETRLEEPAADARKAEGASWTALRMPRPPCFTGSEAWIQAGSGSLRETLAILLVMDLSKLS